MLKHDPENTATVFEYPDSSTQAFYLSNPLLEVVPNDIGGVEVFLDGVKMPVPKDGLKLEQKGGQMVFTMTLPVRLRKVPTPS